MENKKMEIIRKVTALSGHDVRIVGTSDNPLFVASDIGKCLGLTNVNMTIKNYTPKERQVHPIQTNGGTQQMTVLTCAGLYQLVYTSRTRFSAQFRNWVHDILEELRLTGRVDARNSIHLAIERSDEMLKTYCNKPCFYLMKVMDINAHEQVYKLGHTNSSLAERFRKHQNTYADWHRKEKQVTCAFTITHPNPKLLESAVMQRLFPQHRYKHTTHQELVHTTAEFTFDMLKEVIKEEAEKKESFESIIASLQKENDMLRETNQILHETNLRMLEQRNFSDSSKHLASTGVQTDHSPDEPEIQSLINTTAIPRRRTVNSDTARIRIQKIDPQTQQCIKVYYSYNDAVQEHKQLTKSKISHAIEKHCLLLNFRWKKVEDGQENEMEVINLQPTQGSSKPRIEPIVQMTQDKLEIVQVYKNMAQCADAFKKSTGWVHQAVRDGVCRANFMFDKWTNAPQELRQAFLEKKNGILYEDDKPVIIRTIKATGETQEYIGNCIEVAHRINISPDKLKELIENTTQEYAGSTWKQEVRKVPVHVNDI